MIKKILLGMLVATVVVASLAWFKRIDLMLAFIKFKSDREYVVAPNKPIDWQQGPAEVRQQGSDNPPNIILILVDDLGLNDISSFGGGVAGGRVSTPNIDRLAAEGAVFTQAYSGAASCAPSRAMILTGRYSTRTGFEFTPTPSGMGPTIASIANQQGSRLYPVDFNAEAEEGGPSYEEQGLPSQEITVAEVLQDKGYHTVHIGKWHLGRGKGFTPNDQGFDESLLMASGLYLPEDDPNVVNAKVDFDPIDKFLWARLNYAASYNNGGEDRFEPAGYLTDYWTNESIKVIKANRNRPFFLYLAHWGVHTPLQATREDYVAVGDIKPHRLRVYAAMVRALDRSVARITQTLEEAGLADNTIIMFSSDNGGAGYIGLPDINAPYRGWKLTMFEGGIRVPMFVKWPTKIAPGTQLDAPVAHIDMMPTMLSAARASLPENVVIDGIDIMPFATGEATAERPHQTLFWQSAYYRVVRHGDWKLQVSERPKKQWLYNLAQDPTEQSNLAEQNPAMRDKLLALLDQHQASARKPLYQHTLESPMAIDKTLAEPIEVGDEYIYWPN